MAPPPLRNPHPSVRLRLETSEDRVMCGEAGLLSAAVVSEMGMLRSTGPAPVAQLGAARQTEVGEGVLSRPSRPFGAGEVVISKTEVPASDDTGPRRDDRPRRVRPQLLDPTIDLTSAGVADYDPGSRDRSVSSPTEVTGAANMASAGLPVMGNDAAPAVMRAGGATLAVTEATATGVPAAAAATYAAAPPAGTDAGSVMGPLADPNGRPAPEPVAQLSKLTARNRNSATMSGGWNPALRGVLIMNDGSRWFAAESGADIQNNTSIVYYKFQPSGWKAMGSVMLPAGVQQNTATVTNGRLIYSYGVAGSTIIEAWFDTTRPGWNRATGNAITAGGRAISAGNQANYVGAAWHNNTRVVWWSSVGRGGTGGQWSYAYNSGRGWNGPVVGGAGGYADVGYVRARFDDAGRLRMVGEAYLGTFPGGGSYLVTATVVLGNACYWVPVHPRYARSALDLWREEGASTHFLYRMSPTKVGYAYGPKAKSKPTVFNAMEARFITDGTRLGLVLAYQKTLEVRLVPREQAAGWVDWAAVPPITMTLPDEFKGRGVSAIWPADEWRQPHATDRLEFAIAGGYPARDHLIYYVTL